MADHFNISSNGTNISLAALSNTSSAPPGCLVLHYQDFLPWDNPTNVISAETEDLVRRLKDAVVLPILFLIGGPANVLNMAVFYKQGLKERINVCLFALSLADFLYLLQIIVSYSESINFYQTERYVGFYNLQYDIFKSENIIQPQEFTVTPSPTQPRPPPPPRHLYLY